MFVVILPFCFFDCRICFYALFPEFSHLCNSGFYLIWVRMFNAWCPNVQGYFLVFRFVSFIYEIVNLLDRFLHCRLALYWGYNIWYSSVECLMVAHAMHKQSWLLLMCLRVVLLGARMTATMHVNIKSRKLDQLNLKIWLDHHPLLLINFFVGLFSVDQMSCSWALVVAT